MNQHKRLVAGGSIAVIILLVLFNLYFYVIGPSLVQPVSPVLDESSDPALNMTTSGQGSSLLPVVEPTQMQPFNWIPLVISGGVIILVIAGIVVVISMTGKQKTKRDEQRKRGLADLAKGFEAYYVANSHYPMSSSYAPEYYTGLNFVKDWEYYGLPSFEEMRKYIPNFPVLDPSKKPNDEDQTNRYIYYPRDNGQRFDLYAHLEAPDKDATDFNRRDSLPSAWGVYNYRVSSASHATAPASQQLLAPASTAPLQPLSTVVMQPVSAPSDTAQPAPSAQPIASPAIVPAAQAIPATVAQPAQPPTALRANESQPLSADQIAQMQTAPEAIQTTPTAPTNATPQKPPTGVPQLFTSDTSVSGDNTAAGPAENPQS